MANEKEWQQDISTTVDAHTAKLSDHENRLNQAETNIADHEKRIDNIETTSNVGQFATRIQAVEYKVRIHLIPYHVELVHQNPISNVSFIL